MRLAWLHTRAKSVRITRAKNLENGANYPRITGIPLHFDISRCVMRPGVS